MDSIDKLKKYLSAVRQKIYRPPEGLLRYPYLSAGFDGTHEDLVDWDAIWSGIYYLTEEDAPEPLKNSLLNLIDHIAPDGKGQKRISPDQYANPAYQIRPLLITAVYELSKRIGIGWLDASQVERLGAYLDYWHRRSTGRHGLLKWLSVGEGFADNNLATWTWEPNAVEAVDLNTQMVREHRAFAWLLDRIAATGSSEKVSLHLDIAEAIAARIERFLWCEDHECYYPLYNPPKNIGPAKWIEVVHYTSLFPLWAGISESSRAQRMLRRYVLAPDELYSDYGIRSMSRSDPRYNTMQSGYVGPKPGDPVIGPVARYTSANWQGPVWPVCTYIAVAALSRYGMIEEAKRLAGRAIEVYAGQLERNGCFSENLNPETGEAQGKKHIVSWFALIPCMFDHIKKPLFDPPAVRQESILTRNHSE